LFFVIQSVSEESVREYYPQIITDFSTNFHKFHSFISLKSLESLKSFKFSFFHRKVTRPEFCLHFSGLITMFIAVIFSYFWPGQALALQGSFGKI